MKLGVLGMTKGIPAPGYEFKVAILKPLNGVHVHTVLRNVALTVLLEEGRRIGNR